MGQRNRSLKVAHLTRYDEQFTSEHSPTQQPPLWPSWEPGDWYLERAARIDVGAGLKHNNPVGKLAFLVFLVIQLVPRFYGETECATRCPRRHR